MRRRAASIALWIAAGTGVGLPGAAADTPAPAEALAAFLADPDAAGAAGRCADALAAAGLDANAAADLLRRDARYPPARPGASEHSLRFDDGGKTWTVRFTVVVPRGYRRDRPSPLLLAAHGQGSNGRAIAHTMARLLGESAREYVIVAPTMPGPRAYSGKRYQEQAYLRPLRWVRRRHNIDDARIYVAGYSQGGHCTWHLGVLFGRHFAAGVAMAGTPWFEGAPHTSYLYLENLRPLAFWSIWGERDRPPPPALGQVHFNREAASRLKELGVTSFRGTELPGVGHGGCWPGRRELAAFLADARRDPAPGRVVHRFHHEHHRRGYYLEATALAGRPMDMSKPIRLKFRRRPSDAEGDRAMERHFEKYLYEMRAELDRRENALRIRVRRIRGLRVYVVDGLFDLARPVVLRVGRGGRRMTVRSSVRCMLEHYADDRDGQALVHNVLEVAPTGRITAAYE